MATQVLDDVAGDAVAHVQACADCGASIETKFCGQCGQEAHVHRSLGHLFHELLQG